MSATRRWDTHVRWYELTAEVRIPGRIGGVFPFFSEAGNLEALTPDWLNFKLVTPRPIHMGTGTVIDYRIRLRLVTMRWRSRITVWDPPHRFVDEQLKGPYRRWIHEHTFTQDGEEVVCSDHVRYAVPGGPMLETLINRCFVQPELEQIFRYRRQAMLRLLSRTDRGVSAGSPV